MSEGKIETHTTTKKKENIHKQHRISSVEYNEEFRCVMLYLFCFAFLSNFRIEIFIFYIYTLRQNGTKPNQTESACNFFAIADGNGNGVMLNGCFMVAVNNVIMQCSAGIFFFNLIDTEISIFGMRSSHFDFSCLLAY